MDPQTPPTNPANPAPPQPATQMVTPPSVGAEDPGKTLGIVSLVTAILGLSLVGLITGIIARKKSKAAGFKNGLATAGLIISIIGMVVSVIVLTIGTILMIAGVQRISKLCDEHGPGTHYIDGTTLTCGSSGASIKYDSSVEYN